MNHKDKALRIAFVAFRKMSLGTQFSPEELLNLSDLMGIALPMKHRFTKAELSEPIGVGPYTLASRIRPEGVSNAEPKRAEY
jgi:hypothetical protein